MKRSTAILFYTITSFVALVICYLGLTNGGEILTGISIINTKPGQDTSLIAAIHHPLAIFILQLIVIIIASRICGAIFKAMGQPAVMGEIIAGILLGPTLLGSAFPEFSNFLFPEASITYLKLLSQIGLILFMFVIGLELDLEVLKNKMASAAMISFGSMIFPFVFGITSAIFLYNNYSGQDTGLLIFALFMGISLSVTAFPVLARVIKERNLGNTRMGMLSITSAAIGDITAWCILAVIIALARAGTIGGSLFTILYAIVYVSAMLLVVKPALRLLMQRSSDSKILRQSTLAIIFIVLLASALICEVIGIHALFGAFMTGIIMPVEWSIRKTVIDKIEDVALVLLLPLFFVATGLHTRVDLLNTSGDWLVCIALIGVATVGKFGGASFAARLAGENSYDSLSVGALMNTRGLMELIVLNIGLELKILSPKIFAIMVIMAIVTTLMTGPTLSLISKFIRRSP